ncbi:hypothetical protein ACN20G_13170 [Streptomyces sp. BI20]|uniref:hypothetical protein n=1 Tax=Streptomyces sp. BI20 TaxID=3403460 RepID=UPI003C709760
MPDTTAPLIAIVHRGTPGRASAAAYAARDGVSEAGVRAVLVSALAPDEPGWARARTARGLILGAPLPGDGDAGAEPWWRGLPVAGFADPGPAADPLGALGPFEAYDPSCRLADLRADAIVRGLRWMGPDLPTGWFARASDEAVLDGVRAAAARVARQVLDPAPFYSRPALTHVGLGCPDPEPARPRAPHAGPSYAGPPHPQNPARSTPEAEAGAADLDARGIGCAPGDGLPAGGPEDPEDPDGRRPRTHEGPHAAAREGGASAVTSPRAPVPSASPGPARRLRLVPPLPDGSATPIPGALTAEHETHPSEPDLPEHSPYNVPFRTRSSRTARALLAEAPAGREPERTRSGAGTGDAARPDRRSALASVHPLPPPREARASRDTESEVLDARGESREERFGPVGSVTSLPAPAGPARPAGRSASLPLSR